MPGAPLRPALRISRLIAPRGLLRSRLGCSPARRDGGVPGKRSRWLRVRNFLAPSGPGPQSLAPEPQGAGALGPGPEGAAIGRASFASGPGPRPVGAGSFWLRNHGRRARARARGAGPLKEKGPAPVSREGLPNLPLGPGRWGAYLQSAILGSPNAWFGEKNNTKSVYGDVAHHADANCQLRTAGGGGGERPKAKCCLSPDKTRLSSRQKRQVCPITHTASRPAHLESAKRGNGRLRPEPRMEDS